MTDRQQNEFIDITTTLGAGAVVVESLEGEEHVSGLFEYRLRLFSEDHTVDYGSLVGTKATVTLQSADGPRRMFSGIITKVTMVMVDTVNRLAFFNAEMRPWTWLLGLKADCRIFQNQTAPQIIEQIFKDGGYTDYKLSLNATYDSREYCVQYRETALNFICRLMEEEGIFFFFQHATSGHTMVLADDADAHQDCPNVTTLTYRSNLSENVDDDDIISDVSADQQVVTNAYGLENYNFLTPSTDLYANSTGTGSPSYLVYDYPGRHLTTSVGETIAKHRLEALEVQAKLLRGSGHFRNLIAGYKFTVASHPRSEVNSTWVVRSLVVHAARGDYKASFVAFPSTQTFRPRGTAVKPVIPSTQTALVVGKSGEEQWVDKYGRIKVQFYWDRLGKKDENSSCWIRVAQGWAGKSWGMQFLPRIGQEVVVSFLEGDPDRPLVTGSVYNAEVMPPYALPDQQTKSTIMSQTTKNGTGKFNELRFEDKSGSEEIYVHAQKDYNVLVENDVTRTIKHDETVDIQNKNTITVKQDRSRTVSEGNDSLTVSKGTRAVSVTGKETHTNSDNFEQTVSKDYKLTVSGNLTITVTGDLKIEAATITMKSTSGAISETASTGYSLSAGTSVALKSGTTFDGNAGTAMTLKSGTDATVQAGMNLNAKAGIGFTAQGTTATLKGSATGEVDGGGMLTVKGGLVKIN